MVKSHGTTREDKAIELINEGKVQLFPGRGYAIVQGSGKATYKVTKADGCPCPDRARRGLGCKHERAAEALCRVYHDLARRARSGEKIRIPANLTRALLTATAATRRMAEITDDLFVPSDLSTAVA